MQNQKNNLKIELAAPVRKILGRLAYDLDTGKTLEGWERKDLRELADFCHPMARPYLNDAKNWKLPQNLNITHFINELSCVVSFLQGKRGLGWEPEPLTLSVIAEYGSERLKKAAKVLTKTRITWKTAETNE